MPDHCLEPGQEIDDYVILEPIGQGSGGSVYRALQRSLNREVALKITPNVGSEGETMATLDHENVVKVFDERVLTCGKLRLLSMQYVKGISLDRVIKRLKNANQKISSADVFLDAILASNEASASEEGWALARKTYASMDALELFIWFAKRLCSGLEYTHRKQILHLDIKPGNILLHTSGQPMLTDFNISLRKDAEHTHIMGGTRRYMPPEQYRLILEGEKTGIELDSRADVFALAITLKNLMDCFSFPDTGYSRGAIKRLQVALKTAAHLDRTKRFVSAEAFSDELAACLKLHLREKLIYSAKAPAKDLITQPRFWIRTAIVGLSVLAFSVQQIAISGLLPKSLAALNLDPEISRLNSFLNDLKFRWRRVEDPQNPIVIIAIDSDATNLIGSWPWRRDILAYLTSKLFKLGVSHIGMDIVFSEPQHLLPDELQDTIHSAEFETDSKLASAIRRRRENVVLSWISESACQPRYVPCPVADPNALSSFPPSFDQFQLPSIIPPGFSAKNTAIPSAVTLRPSIEAISQAAARNGFANVFTDADGVIRRASLIVMAKGKPHPTFPLAVANAIKGEAPTVSLGAHGEIREAGWKRTGGSIPVDGTGMFAINFRGPERTFPTLSAADILLDERVAQEDLKKILEGSTVLIGITGDGHAYSTPVDQAMPRIEIHANVLDNLLSADVLATMGRHKGIAWSALSVGIFMSLILGALLFKLEQITATSAVLTMLLVACSVFSFDYVAFYFGNHLLPTSFLYAEMGLLFIVTVFEKYLIEEWNRKNLEILALAKENEFLQQEVVRSKTEGKPVLRLVTKQHEKHRPEEHTAIATKQTDSVEEALREEMKKRVA